VGACLINPGRCVGVWGQLKEPPKQAETIMFTQSESSGERCNGIGDRAGVVIDLSEGLNDYWGDCVRLFAVGE